MEQFLEICCLKMGHLTILIGKTNRPPAFKGGFYDDVRIESIKTRPRGLRGPPKNH